MKKLLVVLPLVLAFCLAVAAQKIAKPTQIPGPATLAQEEKIRQGISLHDQKKYDEAIASYLEVLAENPDSTLALYELALTYHAKGDKVKAKETAYRGAKYVSEQLPLFYGTIANCLDDEGKPDEAIKLYRDAEDILKSFPDLKHHLSSIYYNLAITYFRQKKYQEARTEAKRAVENNFGYASPHYLLSIIFNGTSYKVPALLASARFISLEYNTQRTAGAVRTFTEILKPASKDPKTGNIQINLNFNSPKDEGDFAIFELLLGTLTTMRGDDDKDKTDNQMFIEGISSVISILAEDKKMSSTFIGKNYLPFMVDLEKNGHLDALGNMVLYLNNKENVEAAKWLSANDPKLKAFLQWAKAYQKSGK